MEKLYFFNTIALIRFIKYFIQNKLKNHSKNEKYKKNYNN